MSLMSSLLTNLFDAWNAAGIRYLILRNYEELPEHTGNDIDVLVDPAHLDEAREILGSVTREHQWRMHNVGEFACLSLFFHHVITRERLHIDLMSGLNWRAFRFLDERLMLDQRRGSKNFYIPNPAHEAVVNLMTRLIYGGYVKEKYREGIRLSALGAKEEMAGALAPWIGSDLAEKIVTWAAEGRWEKIETSRSKVRKNVLLANFRTSRRVLWDLGADGARFFRRLKCSPGMSVAIFGPDGCGKTSVANGLKDSLLKTFYPDQSAHFHWKPMPARHRMSAPTVDPHGLPPRGQMLSLAYFIYHYLPFVWGWWRYVKPVLFKNGLVIIDRYYYDFFVDLRRYRLNLPRWIVTMGFVFVKNPDLVFCLDADPEVLQARKKEVSFEECRRQREAYRALAEKLPDGHVIDAAQPLEKVVQDVQAIVLQYMAERTATRMGKS